MRLLPQPQQISLKLLSSSSIPKPANKCLAPFRHHFHQKDNFISSTSKISSLISQREKILNFSSNNAVPSNQFCETNKEMILNSVSNDDEILVSSRDHHQLHLDKSEEGEEEHFQPFLSSNEHKNSIDTVEEENKFNFQNIYRDENAENQIKSSDEIICSQEIETETSLENEPTHVVKSNWKPRAIAAASPDNSPLAQHFPFLSHIHSFRIPALHHQKNHRKSNSEDDDDVDEYGFSKRFTRQANYYYHAAKANRQNNVSKSDSNNKLETKKNNLPLMKKEILQISSSYSSSYSTTTVVSSGCKRCGRPNHSAERCNARTHISDDLCRRCSQPGHWECNCKCSSSFTSANSGHNSTDNSGTYVLASSVSPCYRYVGTSGNIARRFEQHVTGIGGAKFTKNLKKLRRVRPIPLVPLSKSVVPKILQYCDETRQTLMQMRYFGVDSVRGAAFCKQEHNNGDYFRLTRMFGYEDDMVSKQIKKEMRISGMTTKKMNNGSDDGNNYTNNNNQTFDFQTNKFFYSSLEKNDFWANFMGNRHEKNNHPQKNGKMNGSRHANLF